MWEQVKIEDDPSWQEYTRPVETATKGAGRVNVWLRSDGNWYASFNGDNVRAMTGLSTEVPRYARQRGYEWARNL